MHEKQDLTLWLLSRGQVKDSSVFVSFKCHLSIYWFRSVNSHSVSPLLKSTYLIKTPKPRQFDNERLLEFEDGQNTIIDIDLLYGVEPKTKIPGLDRGEKEMLKQILVDMIDISLNEYNMHYIWHTDTKYGHPYTSIHDLLIGQIKDFYEYSIKRIPFDLWTEVIEEHSQILMGVLPLTLQKVLIDLRFKYTKAYTKHKMKTAMSEFNKRKFTLHILRIRRHNWHLIANLHDLVSTTSGSSRKKEDSKVHVFSTEASSNDPTVLTEDEYTEIMISDVLNTPFHEFLNEELEKKFSKNLVLSFMNYMKNTESDVIKAYNRCHGDREDFLKFTGNKNRTIENYKRPRGFPLELDPNCHYLYSLDTEVKYDQLLKMKLDNEKAMMKSQLQPKRK